MKSANTKFTTDELKQVIGTLNSSLDIKKLKRTGKNGSTIIEREFYYDNSNSKILVFTNRLDNEIRKIEFYMPNTTDYVNPNIADDITGYEFVLMYDAEESGMALYVRRSMCDDNYRGEGMEKFIAKYNFDNLMENTFLIEMDEDEAHKQYPTMRQELEDIGGKFSNKLLEELKDMCDWVEFTKSAESGD